MSDIESDYIKRLQEIFPRLSIQQARDIMKRNDWNVESALEEAGKCASDVLSPRSNIQNFHRNHSRSTFNKDENSSDSAVVAPDTSADMDNLIQGLFSYACNNDVDNDLRAPSGSAFYGRGRRVGHTEGPSPYIASTLRQQRDVSVTLYRNGIYVNSGLFIEMESSEGREFLDAMRQGHIPSILLSQYPDCELNVTLRDQLDSVYKSTADTPFKGQGYRLSSEDVSSTTQVQTSFDVCRSFYFAADEDSSFVCILNTRGERKVFKVNPLRHTVEDLYYLAHSFEREIEHFILVVRCIPPYKLESSTRTQTIEEAKLNRAVLSIQPM